MVVRALSLVALLFGLRVFLDAVTQGKVQDRERRVQKAHNIKSAVSVSADPLHNCWRDGFEIECRWAGAALTRRYHAKQMRICKK